jgi:signal transduction histidine kinase
MGAGTDASRSASGAVPIQLDVTAELETARARGSLELLALGGAAVLPDVGSMLARFGVDLASAEGDEELLACLTRDADDACNEAPRLVGVLLAPQQSACDAAHVAGLIRRSPRHQCLPILLPRLAAPAGSPALAQGGGVEARGGLEESLLPLSLGSCAELESQLALLLELHHARTRAFRLARHAERVQEALSEAQARNTALEQQAGAARVEAEVSRSQLVQASKLALLGELVAGIAHEINNPLSFSLSHLATIRGGLGRALRKLTELAPELASDNDRLEERFNSVKLGLDRIKGLVVKLSTFSRLDDGEPRPVRVAEAIATVLAIVQHRMGDHVEVSTELHEPNVIHCDRSLIDQCVTNLVVNAIDAIGAEGRLVIRAGAEGDGYVIRVLDSGPGIPEPLKQRVFDPFFTTKPAGKGTGLGLSIASSIVQKHGGTLTLEAGSAGGTEAVISLPMARVGALSRSAAAAR